MKNEKEEFGLLYAHIEDLCARAQKGDLAPSSFLSPREIHYACRYLARTGVSAYAFGGYANAERQKLYLLPDYIERSELCEENFVSRLREFGFDSELCAIRIEGSGYRTLTHRDFLGSLLALGIERDVLGDILVDPDEHGATVFCESRMLSFLNAELLRVANDKVRIEYLALEDVSIPERRFEKLCDTVASARLDCVIAALCNLSREKARQVVTGSLVELNYESEERPDREVEAPAVLSVRGYGRYRILRLEDRTRKGRLRLEAEKYR